MAEWYGAKMLRPICFPAALTDFFRLNARAVPECACRAYALERDRGTVLEFFRESLWSFNQALEANAPLQLFDVITDLNAALILNTGEMIARIAALPRQSYLNPNVEYPECMYLAQEAEAHLASGRDEKCAESMRAAMAGIASPKVGRTYGTMSNRCSVLQRRSCINNFPDGAIDAQGLGLARIAVVLLKRGKPGEGARRGSGEPPHGLCPQLGNYARLGWSLHQSF